VFARHKHFYDFYMQTQMVVNFHYDIQQELLEAYRKVDPYYHFNNSCPVCVVDFLKTVYNYYNAKNSNSNRNV
jgi:hypothetical protein